MKTMIKKIFVVGAAICCGMMAWASEPIASGTCGDSLTWVLNSDSVLTISGNIFDFNRGVCLLWVHGHCILVEVLNQFM